MIQRHTILLNKAYSAQTANISSSLTTAGGYQVNNVQGLGGGIVNASNVRGFLNDDVNDIIINDFFSYLTGTTTTVEFAEIYHSDQKLADVFNEYYVSSVLNNQMPSTSVINQSLAGTSGFTVIGNEYHNLDGVAPYTDLKYIPLSINNSTRILNVYSALTTYTIEQSYYIPVFIKRNNKQMARLNFKDEVEVVSLIVNNTPSQGGLTLDVPINIGDLFTPTEESYSSYGYGGSNTSQTTESQPPISQPPESRPPISQTTESQPPISQPPESRPSADSESAPSNEVSIFERFLK